MWLHRTQSALVQIMACHLFGAKPLSDPMLTYCQFDPQEYTSVKFESKYQTFVSWKCFSKCRLQNEGHLSRPPCVNEPCLPLLGPQDRLMPFRLRTSRESSASDSVTLKSHKGLTSKNAMSFLRANVSAIMSLTWRLNARWQRFPTRILGTPGACWENEKREIINQ